MHYKSQKYTLDDVQVGRGAPQTISLEYPRVGPTAGGPGTNPSRLARADCILVFEHFMICIQGPYRLTQLYGWLALSILFLALGGLPCRLIPASPLLRLFYSIILISRALGLYPIAVFFISLSAISCFSHVWTASLAGFC